MFFISLHMVSYQRAFPFCLSNSFPCFIDLRMLTPKLCVQTQYFDFIFSMMWLHFASTCRIHRANSESPEIWRCAVYSAICKGYELFISLRVTHIVLPSFHWTSTSTPFVVSMWRFYPVHTVMNASCSFTLLPSYLRPTISWNRTYWFPSPLTWANMLSAIALAASKSLCPSLYYTSYILVSRI